MLYVWYPKNRTDLNTIHEENDVRVKAQLKWEKHIYLFNYENGTPKSLYDSLSLVTGLLQDSYQEIIRLL